jgi:WD40 repeat protein
VLELEDGVQSLTWKAAPANVIFAQDGTLLASQNSDGIVIRDLESDRIVSHLSLGKLATEAIPGEYLTASFYDGHSKFAALHSFLGNLVSWDIESGTSTWQGDPNQFTAYSYSVSPAFSPDGNYLVYGGNKALEIWNVVNAEPYTGAAQIARTDEMSMRLAFSPDASLMALATGKRILVYRFPELSEIIADISIEESTMGLNFVMEADGTPRYLIILDSNGNTRIWDWNRRTQLGETMSGSIQVVGTNTQDRSTVYLDSSGKLIRFAWGQDQQSWRDQLCPVVQRNFTKDEWALYFPGMNYPEPENLTCPGYPSELQAIIRTGN